MYFNQIQYIRFDDVYLNDGMTMSNVFQLDDEITSRTEGTLVKRKTKT